MSRAIYVNGYDDEEDVVEILFSYSDSMPKEEIYYDIKNKFLEDNLVEVEYFMTTATSDEDDYILSRCLQDLIMDLNLVYEY